MAALRGEMNTFVSGPVRAAISPSSLKANRLSAATSWFSAPVSWRGRAVIGRGAVRVASRH